jgi:glycosyltransferase involved in cell wall biosynthesis
MKKTPVSVIILTYNEELNLEHCLKSVVSFAEQIIVVDSMSTDRTQEIAKRYGAEVHEHPFKNQADQFNWALDHLAIRNEWVLRLDADEYLLPELVEEIAHALPHVPGGVSGFFMKRRVYFMGRWIRHGGYYPTWILRLFRKGVGRSEEREMDEHIILNRGEVGYLKNDFVDENRHPLSWWIERYNKYSTREASAMRAARGEVSEKLGGSQTERKRWLKNNLYYRSPKFLRAFLYFIYRYFFLLGFLDGVRGLMFHSLQGFWYRFLVDAKLYEAERKQK